MTQDEIRQELLEVANKLGLEFPKNIPTEKLQILVDNALQDSENTVTENQNSAVDKKSTNTVDIEKEIENDESISEEHKKQLTHRARIKKAKDEAMKTRIVTITNKDTRESDTVTTAYLSFENQYFGVSKIVPLDTPVELEQALISVAESTMITLHKDEVVNGQRTGNKIPVTVKKYAISYEQRDPD